MTPATQTTTIDPTALLAKLGIEPVHSGAYAGEWLATTGAELEVTSPGTGEVIGRVRQATAAEYDRVVEAAQEAFGRWRQLPAPIRGEYVRRMGNAMREKKDELGAIVTLEMGKILQEGLGEVQEAIDIADFAVGQSRMLYGLSMHSERPGHAMREQWHPLGTIGIISAFNFPSAVWAWNSMIALICGDACVWKPSPKTPLTAIAMTNVCRPVLEEAGFGALLGLAIGTNEEVGERLVNDKRLPLVSFTGSSAVGGQVAGKVASRFGRTILELGGNNAMVVTENADLDLAIPAILFGSVGTAGQRCTSTRRLILHESVADEVESRLIKAYGQIQIGNPLDPKTLCGPLIDQVAVDNMHKTLEQAKAEGAEVLCGGESITLDGAEAGGHYVTPCLVRAKNEMQCVQNETFAPIVYLMRYSSLDDAIAMHNAVPQGLSSAIFTLNVREAETFLSAAGSDCGIANVNIGTSGAEIGGAFGGEKETGGGRESGSDAWKAYMRRQTNTVNWSTELPLAQGIQFG
ncbi:Succinate-semialdehyde dehydrogenase [NADP(+)] [Planctomycetes bacterium Pla163]|uniref:aldehyde dehydrogenase (NAD(+)) n=1 Tax=Rohdeia mirabilis TaxID=2528008 RepID=A0A518D1H4_9BACT|nr:Succinate-semialdehyde dehydrogenase [NADP(+)] [Planctomycetes bacterium Pla163]